MGGHINNGMETKSFSSKTVQEENPITDTDHKLESRCDVKLKSHKKPNPSSELCDKTWYLELLKKSCCKPKTK